MKTFVWFVSLTLLVSFSPLLAEEHCISTVGTEYELEYHFMCDYTIQGVNEAREACNKIGERVSRTSVNMEIQLILVICERSDLNGYGGGEGSGDGTGAGGPSY